MEQLGGCNIENPQNLHGKREKGEEDPYILDEGEVEIKVGEKRPKRRAWSPFVAANKPRDNYIFVS